MPGKDVGLLVLLVAIAAAVGLLLTPEPAPPQTGGDPPRASTLYNRPHGTKALLLAMQRLGIDAQRFGRSYRRALLERVEVLIILEPYISIDDDDEASLLRWVRRGGTLVFAPGPAEGGAEGWSRPRQWGIEAWLRFDPDAQHARTMDRHREPVTARTLEIDGEDAADPLLHGVHRVALARNRRFDPESPLAGRLEDATWQGVGRDGTGWLALRVRHGEGTILALSEAYPLTNRGLREADNETLAANLAHELAGWPPRRTVHFDETAHGHRLGDPSMLAMLQLVFGGTWGLAIVQLMLVALLYLLAGSVAFGRRWGVPPPPPRPQTAFIHAAAALLRRHNATERVWAALWQHHWRRLCERMGAPSTVTEQELAQRIRRRTGIDAADLLAEARRARMGTGPDPDTLSHLVRGLRDLMEQIDHAMGPSAAPGRRTSTAARTGGARPA